MFEATEVERKIKEINLLIDMQINLSLCRISYHYFSLSLQQLPWDSIRTKMDHLCMRKIFGKQTNHGSRKDAAEITPCISCWNNKLDYKLARWGRLLKKSLEQVTACMKRLYHNRESGNPNNNIPSPQNYFQTSCQSLILMLLKRTDQHWEYLFERSFADLRRFCTLS